MVQSRWMDIVIDLINIMWQSLQTPTGHRLLDDLAKEFSLPEPYPGEGTGDTPTSPPANSYSPQADPNATPKLTEAKRTAQQVNAATLDTWRNKQGV